MELKNAQVLITGGSDGIGKGLSKRLLAAGCKVLVTGRSGDKLQRAIKESPELLIYENDIGIPEEREALAKHVAKVFPGLNVIINNAGIQRRKGLAEDHAEWSERQPEIDILLSAPVHLNHLLIPLLLRDQKNSLIVNVSSGGGYIPQVFAPVYSACKAAIHSYTMTLRHSLSDTTCRVAELIPPAVQTSLAGSGQVHGAPLDEFCDAVFKGLFLEDRLEVGFDQTANISLVVGDKPQAELFNTFSARFPVTKY